MSRRRSALSTSSESLTNLNDPLRELFEACKTGDLARVKKLVNSQMVNARDTAGRKSTPLHFAAGKFCENDCFIFNLNCSLIPHRQCRTINRLLFSFFISFILAPGGLYVILMNVG